MPNSKVDQNLMLTGEQFLIYLIGAIIFLTICYFILNAIEKAKVRKLSKPKYIYLKTGFLNKYIERLFEIPFMERLIKNVSYKISYLNTSDVRVNYRNALLLIICALIMSVIFLVLMIIKGIVWYLAMLYIGIIVLIIYVLVSVYSEMKEIKLAKQLPEALNDLKIAYDNKKRLKLAIQQAYEDMPRDIKKEFARLAEADNLEEALIHLKNKIKNPWFKLVLTLMLLTVQKGDKEGALSEQLQSLNGIISQEILIKESNRLLFQLYKLFILVSPVVALLMREATKDISERIVEYYQSIEASYALAMLLLACIGLYLVLDVCEKI